MPEKNWFILLGYVFVAEAAFFGVACFKNDINILEISSLVFFIRRVGVSFSFLLICIVLLRKLPAGRIVLIVAALFYGLLVFVDSIVYFFGNTLFEWEHLDLLTTYSVGSFFGVELFIFLAVVLIYMLLFSLWLRYSDLDWSIKKSSFGLAAGLLFVSIYLPGYYAEASINSGMGELPGYLQKMKTIQLTYLSRSSIENFWTEMRKSDKQEHPVTKKSLSEFQAVLERYGLPLGDRQYEDLGLAPFNKIVLFMTESLSLDLLPGYNVELGGEQGFYSSAPIRERMFLNYRTSAHNTLQGIATTLNSHPNFSLLVNGLKSRFDNSLVRILKAQGYETIFLRTASKFYANENVHFKNLGFDKIIAREYFDQVAPGYVKGWGAFDRKMYEALIDLLKTYKDRKVFIAVLGTDTHPPDGRQYYADLEYPHIDIPAGLDESTRKFLRSVRNHEYDMGQTLERMRVEGLLSDDTLVVLTADHATPFNNVVKNIDGYPRTSLARIPVCFLTSQTLPDADRAIMASQMDLAPTILHLLHKPIPEGYWGSSLFSKSKKSLYVGFDAGSIFIENNNERRTIPVTGDLSPDDAEFLELFQTLIVDDTVGAENERAAL